MTKTGLIPKRTVTSAGVFTTVYVKPYVEESKRRFSSISNAVVAARTNAIVRVPGSSPQATVIDGKWDGKPAIHDKVRMPRSADSPTGFCWTCQSHLGYEDATSENYLNGEWKSCPHCEKEEPEYIQVAPNGYSGRSCWGCNSFFTDEEENDEAPFSDSPNLVCRICGETSYGVNQSNIRESAIPFLDTENVYEETWVHITTNPNWNEAINALEHDDQPLVHIGTLASALSRMTDLIREQYTKADDSGNIEVPQFYLYRININEDARISSNIVGDDNDLAPTSIASSKEIHVVSDGYELGGITRYINDYEVPGSISLVAHPSALIVSEPEPITL